MSKKSIIYIGDFDMINSNVQSHLVKANGKMLSELGYFVYYIGVDRNRTPGKELIFADGEIIHVCNTLNIKGLKSYSKVTSLIMSKIKEINDSTELCSIITYQSPCFALLLRDVSKWCFKNKVRYIVNCADLPVFRHGNIFRDFIMWLNWEYMHYINNKYADGIIAVSTYISDFFKKDGRPSIIIPPLLDGETITQKEVNRDPVVSLVYAGQPFPISIGKVRKEGMKDRLDIIIQLLYSVSKLDVKFHLDVVGISKEEYLHGVPEQVSMVSELKSKITFWGRQNHEFTKKIVSEADGMINYRDINKMTLAGMSTKVVESVSLGTPVIMNDVGDTFTYLVEGISGYKLQNDPLILQSIIQSIQCNKDGGKQKCLQNNPFKPSIYIKKLSLFLKDCKI